ncbi:hypothetical protein [uncultured Methanobrevibacter sp.]|uniref:hypothetical protein n=1 Tax=uncultured Methanobrevibacter sp. TaxID=253161 RepID=UPI0025FB2900|nr:hypothetical protein [uncultured Methanobrevibacter sp.]MCI6994005.1 hypothetical protein [Methanobrevibacter sp.]
MDKSIGYLIVNIIRLFGIYIIFVPLGLSSTAMFQSAQKGFTSLSLVILRDLLLSAIFAYILGILLNFGVYGIYVGIILGMIVSSIFSYFYFNWYLDKLKNN